MKNYNDFFESLSRMAEEYQKLIAPIRDQVQLPERWHEISSPILRIAETNKEILEGMTSFDTEIAKRLEAITAPYQTYFDTISSVGRIMDTTFGAFVKPDFYVPNISNALSAITDTTTSVLRVNTWQVELSSLVDIDTSIFVGIDNPFKRLAEIEQAVAGLVQVQNLRSQMTSITAQIASLFQVGMNDEWRSVIIPNNLLDSLNSFALKQYVHIQKNRDPKEVAWRLGLVEVASKYVDNQILFGTEIAIDFDDIIPTIEAEYPDLSEFPVFFGSAKRDGKEVSEKFDESTYNIISEKAKLIYQKAKSINDFCKARGIPSLFSESRLINWAFELGRSFCRNTNSLAIVTDTLFAMFVREEIIDLIGYQSCFDTIKKYRGGTQDKKSVITMIQKTLYDEIIEVEDKLVDILSSQNTIVVEEKISTDVYKALVNILGNKIYDGVNENTFNDGVRDALSMIYEVKDQTRVGVSESGKDAGEADVIICDKGNPVAIIEGMKVNCVNSDYISRHIDKALINYDPFGCPLVYILIYSTAVKFDAFWTNLVGFICNTYKLPFDSDDWKEVNTIYSNSRHAKTTVHRNGKNSSIHLFAISVK